MDSQFPLVSAVIPTRNRPEMVCRAVRSALNQTYENLEVVVVIDGPDAATVAALEALNEPRLRVVALTENVGGGEARNVGVRESRGEWIAFLDDDDEWFPEKTRRQIDVALASPKFPVIVASQYIDRSQRGDVVRPEISQRSGQSISEYLFCEISLFGLRQGFLQTSTWLVPKLLCTMVPFTRGMKRNQDTDWMLRAVPQTKTEVIIVHEVLTIFHNEEVKGRISKQSDWRYSFEWVITSRSLFTRRSVAFYLATQCLPLAMQVEGRYKAAVQLLVGCFRYGEITPKIVWFFLRYAIFFPLLKVVLPDQFTKRARLLLHR